MKYFLMCFTILVASCCCTPDTFDCNSRPKLKLSDIYLPPAEIGVEYNAELKNVKGLCFVVLKNDSSIPDGLKLIKLESNFFLKGIPKKTGEFVIEFTGTEFGTQCPGRSADFKVFVNIIK